MSALLGAYGYASDGVLWMFNRSILIAVLVMLVWGGIYLYGLGKIKNWPCTKTHLVGESPNRREECTQRTMPGAENE